MPRPAGGHCLVDDTVMDIVNPLGLGTIWRIADPGAEELFSLAAGHGIRTFANEECSVTTIDLVEARLRLVPTVFDAVLAGIVFQVVWHTKKFTLICAERWNAV